jgi:hypothetical protein
MLQPLPRALAARPWHRRRHPDRQTRGGSRRPANCVLGHADGVLTLRADRIGVTQRANQWMLVSGDAKLTLGEKVLDVLGKFKVDAGYWELAKSGTPQLSDDVVIIRAGDGKAKVPPACSSAVLEHRRRPGTALPLSRRRRRKPPGGLAQDRVGRIRNAAGGPVRFAPSAAVSMPMVRSWQSSAAFSTSRA